jgi:hypothetical protein
MGSKRDDKLEGIAKKTVAKKTVLPGDEDVEAHGFGGRSKGAIPDDEGVGPDKGFGGRSKGVVPGDDEDVEGHIFKSKLPNDSPHPEGTAKL